ncbi:hypothetical protein A5893_01780 [Pedobacter psychrophilus]|uniref:histidine kinase n=1 Tax=Pedobacter psychrophilus TaxID=1826909 RepID=A0A179DMZ7_9SPHI|nr:tetratricopeptide repeat protein [Pedobacter psychrophilus]OAQ41873.1 hypothetical protein A5893_01780 [Pedobacter psychrophilus]
MYKLLTKIFIFFALFIQSSSFAQNNLSPSYKKQLNLLKKLDSNYVNLQLKLADSYFQNKPDTSIYYYLLLIKNAQKLNLLRQKLTAFDHLGQAYYSTGKLDAALKTFIDYEIEAKSNKDKSIALRNQGNIFIEKGEPNKALDYYKRSLIFAEAAKDRALIATCLNNIAYVYRQQGVYANATNYQLQAIKIFEQEKHYKGIGDGYVQLALMHLKRKNYDDAISYSSKAKINYENINLNNSVAITYNILAGAYSGKGNQETALNYLHKCLEIYNTNNDYRQIGNTLSDIAQIELENNQNQKALATIKEALINLEKSNYVNGILSSKVVKAKILSNLNELNEANQILTQVINTAVANNFREILKKAYEAKVDNLEKLKDFEEAFIYNKKLSVLNDSILNTENLKQINELNKKFETEKKEQQITLLNTTNKLQSLSIFSQNLDITKQNLFIDNQKLEIIAKQNQISRKSLENQQNLQNIKILRQKNQIQRLELEQKNIFLIIASVGLILILLITYLVLNRRKIQAAAKMQEELRIQQEIATRKILDAEERERRRIAGDLHDGVGQTLSAALLSLNGLVSKIDFKNPQEKELADHAVGLVNESYDEMRSISHQMMPNALLKAGLSAAIREFISKIDQNMLKVSLETTGLQQKLDEQVETVIYRVIQEITTNVIKHANANKMSIQIANEQKEISISIEDNGSGFDASKLADKEGVGIRNIKDRIASLNGVVEFDSNINKGTLVNIYIPI